MRLAQSTPLGEVELMLRHRKQRVYELEQDWADLEEHVVELFNPPDDDSESIYSMIDRAHAYITAQPCSCVNTDPEPTDVSVPYDDGDRCGRCEVLGRYFDNPVQR